MTQAKIRIDPALAELGRSAWESLIHEANLGRELTEVAKEYFIEKQCQIDIAIQHDSSRSTVMRQVSNARRRIEEIYFDNLKS